jgi:hypothetical protein
MTLDERPSPPHSFQQSPINKVAQTQGPVASIAERHLPGCEVRKLERSYAFPWMNHREFGSL